MRLTREEEAMLDGSAGASVQKAMQLLVTLGEAFDAEGMVEVSSVHLAGPNVAILDDEPIDYVEAMSSDGTQFRVPTTSTTQSVDWDLIDELAIPTETQRKQERLTRSLVQMGAILTHTCAPYIAGNTPMWGEHIVWGESSAVIYANSVLGARTNREGEATTLASAITGRTPNYGYHVGENRRGEYLVVVEAPLLTATDFGVLGHYVGSLVGGGVPVFSGVTKATTDQLKQLGAALASSGGVPLYHVVGVTPEARTSQEAWRGSAPKETIVVGEREMKAAYEHLCRATVESVDVVSIGCPHTSIQELKEIATSIAGRKIHSRVMMWVNTSAATKMLSDRMGYTQAIEAAGAFLVKDTCPINSQALSKAFVAERGYMTLITNSAKQAHYSPAMCNLMPCLGTLNQCLEWAVAGRWSK
jgi:hypothetical protein